MKRAIIFFTLLILTGIVRAQSDDTLTNASIVKMVKAKLTDELIIDVIQTTPVRFDLSFESLQNLAREQVSPPIIDAMRKAMGITPAPVVQKEEIKTPLVQPATPPKEAVTQKATKAATPPPAEKKATKPVTPPPAEKEVKAPEAVEPVPSTGWQTITDGTQSSRSISALSYASPLAGLVDFYKNEFEELSAQLTTWDRAIRDSLQSVNEAAKQIQSLENKLREKKNAGAGAFSSEITQMKNRLEASRTRFRQQNNNLVAKGEEISRNLEKIAETQSKSLGDKYSDVSQQIKSYECDPAAGENPVPVTIPRLKISDKTISCMVPATEMLSWYQNKINEVQKIIGNWNEKVLDILEKDDQLEMQLEPLNKRLEECKTEPKKYKSEISSLKKQVSAITKSRKALASQMEDDSRQLIANLKQARTETQDSLKERFADIIQNINYAFEKRISIQ